MTAQDCRLFRLRSRRAWTALLVCLAPGLAQGAPLLQPGAPETVLAQAGLEALHDGRPARAESLLTAYVQAFPDDPLALLLRFKLWWWSILEGRAELLVRLEEDYDRLQTVAQARLSRDAEDLRALVALGEAHCAMGRLQGIRGQGWAAFQSHRSGVPLLEKALQLDPELAEPRASLGVYHYYAARAPGFLRFIGRLLRVRADRSQGLQELWQGVTRPGLQRFEATFFLIEVLCGVEDDALEAMPLALRLQARHPRSLPAALSLATVHLALERPDLAVAVLAPLASESQPRPVAARFFVARTLCVSGAVDEALELLEGFTPSELKSVTWLQGWHAYYRGLAYEQQGRFEEARRAFQSACEAPEVAESHRYARLALERNGRAFDRRVRAVEASSAWDGDRTAAQRALWDQLQREGDDPTDTGRRARLALAAMALHQGEADRAVEILLPLMRDEASDEAWLVVRPRVRLLQALWRSGRHEEARTWASRFAPGLGDWGSNRHLELLVQTCSQMISPCDAERTGGITQFDHVPVRFDLKDTGFTRVHLQLREGEQVNTIPMELRENFWQVDVHLGEGAHLYRFDLECLQTFPDPAAQDFQEREDGIWSVCNVVATPEWPAPAEETH